MQAKKNALVILSGGQDSTICAYIAKQGFNEVHAITYNYNQRHIIELDAAKAVSEELELNTHVLIDVSNILSGKSPLISDEKLERYNSCDDLPKTGVESTFVPARNILFLTIAGNHAAKLNIQDIFIGVCETDFAGYFDCRNSFIKSMETSLGEGIYGHKDYFTVHTPLMYLTKSESLLLARDLMKNEFDKLMSITHTCYDGVKGGCGNCHACLLRDRGFKEANIEDPIWKFRSNLK